MSVETKFSATEHAQVEAGGQGPMGQPQPANQAYTPDPDRYPGGGARYLWYEHRAVRWGVVVLAIASVVLLTWLLTTRSNGDSVGAGVRAVNGPVATTGEDLVTLSQELHQPVYWSGSIPDTNLELTKTVHGYYVRYLAKDTPIGDPSPDFLTVGTYPTISAFDDLRRYAAHTHAHPVRIRNGGLALKVPGSPTSVFFAYPHEDVQVEVYDPHPGRALELVRSGQVRAVSEEAPGTVGG